MDNDEPQAIVHDKRSIVRLYNLVVIEHFSRFDLLRLVKDLLCIVLVSRV